MNVSLLFNTCFNKGNTLKVRYNAITTIYPAGRQRSSWFRSELVKGKVQLAKSINVKYMNTRMNAFMHIFLYTQAEKEKETNYF